jgi:hypothetical protein
MVSAAQLAFCVGPFTKTNLSDLREYEEEDVNNIRSSVDMFGYSLPGYETSLRNTAIFMSKVPPGCPPS